MKKGDAGPTASETAQTIKRLLEGGFRPRRGPGGRKTKLTPRRAEEICQLVRLGNYVETAAAAVGITARTVRNWERTGRIDADAGRDTPHARFAEAIDEARSESEAVLVSNIRLHASRDIRAAMFLLERRFPKKWGSRATGDENEAEGPRTMTELFDTIAAERDGVDDE